MMLRQQPKWWICSPWCQYQKALTCKQKVYVDNLHSDFANVCVCVLSAVNYEVWQHQMECKVWSTNVDILPFTLLILPYQWHFSWIPQTPRKGRSAWGNRFLPHLFLLCKSWCGWMNVCYVELSVVEGTVHCCQPCHLNNSPNGNLSTTTASLLAWHPRCSVLILTPCVGWMVKRGMGWRKENLLQWTALWQYVLWFVSKVMYHSYGIIWFCCYFHIRCLIRGPCVKYFFLLRLTHLWDHRHFILKHRPNENIFV